MKTSTPQRLRLALLGLACACATGLALSAHSQTITGTNQIAFTDFDTTIPPWSFGYFYSWNVPDAPPEPGTYVYNYAYTDPLPENATVVYRYEFDDAPYEGPVTTNAAGFGTGFGAPLNWNNDSSAFNSVELKDYLISWDARVEGLKPGQTTANCEFQIKLGTGTPALQKNIGYNPGSNWMHFSYTLDDGGYANNTTYVTFTNGLATGITQVEFAQNQHMPSDQFGFDTNNVVYLDNIKLQVLQYSGPPPPPPPVVPLSIVDWNMDDKGLWYGGAAGTNGGWSANNVKATYLLDQPSAGTGVGGSNALLFWMMNEIYATNSPLPAWAGGNGYFGGPANVANVSSPKLSDYQLSMDARVEGLDPASTVANFDFQVRFNTPTETLVRCDTSFSDIGSNWTHVTIKLNKAAVGEGSAASFATNYSQVSEIPVQVQLNNVVNQALWGYDTDNKVFLDNIKLDLLAVGLMPLSITAVGNNVVVTWPAPATGTTQLLSASTVNASYTEVLGATSPYTSPIAGVPKYFRTQWIPPAQ